MLKYISQMICVIQVALSILHGVNGFCWEPNTTPFNRAPSGSRIDGGDRRVRVDWSTAFNDGLGCDAVDFLIMTHPRENPSAYTLSDFTLKGQRSATLQLEGDGDYVFQVSKYFSPSKRQTETLHEKIFHNISPIFHVS